MTEHPRTLEECITAWRAAPPEVHAYVLSKLSEISSLLDARANENTFMDNIRLAQMASVHAQLASSPDSLMAASLSTGLEAARASMLNGGAPQRALADYVDVVAQLLSALANAPEMATAVAPPTEPV